MLDNIFYSLYSFFKVNIQSGARDGAEGYAVRVLAFVLIGWFISLEIFAYKLMLMSGFNTNGLPPNIVAYTLLGISFVATIVLFLLISKRYISSQYYLDVIVKYEKASLRVNRTQVVLVSVLPVILIIVGLSLLDK